MSPASEATSAQDLRKAVVAELAKKRRWDSSVSIAVYTYLTDQNTLLLQLCHGMIHIYRNWQCTLIGELSPAYEIVLQEVVSFLAVRLSLSFLESLMETSPLKPT